MGDTRGYSDDMQISGDGMAAGERTSRHALRALLVLGGTVATPKTLTHAHVVETTR